MTGTVADRPAVGGFRSWVRGVERSRLPAPFNAAPVLAFHRKLPGYQPSPLVEAPILAAQLGVKQLLLKVESSRLGLPSFKILGASWAVYRALLDRFGSVSEWRDRDDWHDWEDLRASIPIPRPFTLIAATDGNHGRAVARMASVLDLRAIIFVPSGTAEARIAGIEEEGASVRVVDGDYDDAVRQSAATEDASSMVVSDTSWPGYEVIPAWVAEGYATIFSEVDEQFRTLSTGSINAVGIPVGVGAFASAAVRHYGAAGRPNRPCLISVEPAGADCLLRSLAAGEIVTVPGPHRSVMAGLNCGTPSRIAWPVLENGVDVAVAIDDEAVARALRSLEGIGISAGETGAAALAGIAELVGPGRDEDLRRAAGLGPEATVLALVTEGVTDPAGYEALVHETPGAPGSAVPDRFRTDGKELEG